MKVLEDLVYDKEKVKSAYENAYTPTRKSFAEIQDERSSIRIRFQNLHAKLGAKLKPHGRLLDIACGDGVKTEALSGFFSSSIGLDFSQSAIDLASRFNNSKLNFIQGDIDEYKNKDGFEYITSFGNSTFNQSNISQVAKNIDEVFKNNCADTTQMLIGSFTDFSGEAPSGWFNHRKEQLDQLLSHLKEKGYQCRLYFPSQDLNNFSLLKLRYTLKEVIRLLKSRRRYYFLHLYKNNG